MADVLSVTNQPLTAAFTDVRGFFQHLHQFRRPSKTKNTHSTPPPTGNHNSKKRCLSPAGTLVSPMAIVDFQPQLWNSHVFVGCSKVTIGGG